MKKLILAGIVIIIGCLIFIIIQQNSSQADITSKYYSVPFNEWVYVWTYVHFVEDYPDYRCRVEEKLVEGKTKYVIVAYYDKKSSWHHILSMGKIVLEGKCKEWTLRGYPISINDFEFDIEAIQ